MKQLPSHHYNNLNSNSAGIEEGVNLPLIFVNKDFNIMKFVKMH